jgi:hypothetical protein
MGTLMAHIEQSLGGRVSSAIHASAYDAPEHFLVQAYDAMSNP